MNRNRVYRRTILDALARHAVSRVVSRVLILPYLLVRLRRQRRARVARVIREEIHRRSRQFGAIQVGCLRSTRLVSRALEVDPIPFQFVAPSHNRSSHGQGHCFHSTQRNRLH